MRISLNNPQWKKTNRLCRLTDHSTHVMLCRSERAMRPYNISLTQHREPTMAEADELKIGRAHV